MRTPAYTRGPIAGDGHVPADFAAFARDHADRLLVACGELTGNAATAAALRDELLAAAALRWRWYRPRAAAPRRAAAYLARLLQRERRTWGRPVRIVGPAARDGPDVSSADVGRGGVGQRVWNHSAGLRRRRRMVAGLAMVAIALVWTFGPRASVDRLGPPPPVWPTAVPEGVTVLPPYGRLSALDPVQIALPERIHVDLTGAPLLTDQPVERAAAILRPDLGPLVVLAPDGSTRLVTDPHLLGADILTTSLSPDGARAALPAAEGLVVLDVATAALRTLPLPAARLGLRALAWRTPATVVVPGVDGALEVNVDTGAVTELPGLTGYDVMATAGPPAPGLTELLTPTPDIDRPRVRVWDASPAERFVDRSRPMPSRPAPAEQEFHDRAIGGPAWLGDWSGPGWATGIFAARGCSARGITLPISLGRARSVVAAVGITGAYAGTLVAVDTTVLEVVGFADPRRVLVAVHAPQVSTTIVAWYPHTAQLRRVTMVDVAARISLPDLMIAT